MIQAPGDPGYCSLQATGNSFDDDRTVQAWTRRAKAITSIVQCSDVHGDLG